MATIVIGNEPSEFVRAEVFDRDKGEDPNCLYVTVTISTVPFVGSCSAFWRAERFPKFREELVALYESLEGSAIFSPDWEGTLVLVFEDNGRGRILLKGNARSSATDGSSLKFELSSIDQTYLPEIIAMIEVVEAEFPPVPA